MSESLQRPELYGNSLTEVDHLNRFRRADGSHDPLALQGVYENLQPAVKEAAMPHAVSTTHQEYRDGTFWWLDQTPVDVATSGYRFHQHEAALDRVGVEVDEAYDVTHNSRPGMIKIFISPRMSRKDAPYDVAKQEHLADDDMLRIHMLDIGGNGELRGKFMQSLLVRHVPLEAWVRMLRDPRNIFGKSIAVEDEDSALSVMKVHKQLEVPEAALPEGVVSLVKAVLPYVDEKTRPQIEQQLVLFRDDQETLHAKAGRIADRWLAFEVTLADSLHDGYATTEIQDFIRNLAFEWNDEMATELMRNTDSSGRIRMTRSLAAKLETSRQNTLWVSAGVITGNKHILGQLSSQAAQDIYEKEMFIQTMMQNGSVAREIWQMESQNNKTIAGQNIQAGGGCPGVNSGSFGSSPGPEGSSGDTANQRCPEVKNGQSVKCPGCKEIVKAIVPNKEKIYCSNAACKLAAPHLKANTPGPAHNNAGHPAKAVKTQMSSEAAGVHQETNRAKRGKVQSKTGELALAATH